MSEDKFEPKPVESYECAVCSIHKKKPEEARQCAMDDTRKMTVENVIRDDAAGYPTVFLASFRTGVNRAYARVEKCEACKGIGEVDKTEGVYPCSECNGIGYILAK